MNEHKPQFCESTARRIAKKNGLHAIKSRRQRNSLYNLGGFQLLDDYNRVIAGEKLELTPDDVVAVCKSRH